MNNLIKEKTEVLDISKEFLELKPLDFLDFTRKTIKNKIKALSIKIDWVDEKTAIRLKAFLEDSNSIGIQKKYATIIATKDEYMKALNVFAS